MRWRAACAARHCIAAAMAGYMLRDGLSFCTVGDRSIFLDLLADRYFCLNGPLDRAFAALLGTGAVDPVLAKALIDMGMIITTPDNVRPGPCPAMALSPAPTSVGRTRASFIAVAMALAGRSLWTMRVKCRPLAANVQRLERQKRALTTTHRLTPAVIAQLAEAYRRAALVIPTRDRCLATSMAFMSALIAHGARANLVLGVKLDPFQAHCWVELEGAVVNDEPDLLRPFTPILVV